MTLILGIHHGHHAACALVRNGILVAAVQQERFTRIKADGQEGLSNALPVEACLRAASVRLVDVDMIVSSFQAASPGGNGLHRPLIEADFNLFDPFDRRHFVVSHHLAHAFASFGASGFQDAAVLVCDLGGSTTIDGDDFFLPFGEFKERICSLSFHQTVKTECVSIYEIDQQSVQLHKREFSIPHNAPDVFVSSLAGLYDNISRAIFHRENAHGQLMALASMQRKDHKPEITWSEMLDIQSANICFRNDWQHRVRLGQNELDSVDLASATQLAVQRGLMAYVSETRQLARSANLVGAGGIFLNIIANSEILQSGMFRRFFVPSSPHDAGISIGCAFVGYREIQPANITTHVARNDRMGPAYSREDIDQAICKSGVRHADLSPVSPKEVAKLLIEGMIVARFSGRSEFGPRALGGRSLLASPLWTNTKSRLNKIKGRQTWRPVAPIVPVEKVNDFFEGPSHSPFMNFVHQVRPQFKDVLPALAHPDGSTRAQTLSRSDDTFLYDVLAYCGKETGLPILVNTSLNGPGEPIVETPTEALDFFFTNLDVDCLLVEDQLLKERPTLHWADARWASDTIFTFLQVKGIQRVLMIRGAVSLEISKAAFDRVTQNGDMEDPAVELELQQAMRLRFLVPVAG